MITKFNNNFRILAQKIKLFDEQYFVKDEFLNKHVFCHSLFQNKFKFSSWFKFIVKCCSFQNIPVQCKKTFWSMDAYTQQSIICAFMPTFFVGKPPSPWSGKTSMAWPKKRQHWLFQMQFRFCLVNFNFFFLFLKSFCV